MFILFVLALIVPLALGQGSGPSGLTHYTIVVSPTCDSIYCVTLDMIASSALPMAQRDLELELVFLPGTHLLSQRRSVNENFSLHKVSMTLTGQGGATIACKEGAYLHFTALPRLEINGLTFLNCGVNDLSVHLPMYGLKVFSANVFAVTNCSFAHSVVEAFNCKETVLQSSQFDSIRVAADTKLNMNSGRMDKKILYLVNCSFRGDLKRSGLIVENLQHVSINGSLFENKFSFLDGGAIHIENSTVSLSRVSFYNNSAVGCGAIFARNSDVNITAALFLENEGFVDGVICVLNCTLHVTNTVFTNNKIIVQKGTGGLLSDQSRITLNNVIFTSNTGYNGGAMNINESLLSAHNVVFNDNTATVSGGAIYAKRSFAVFRNSYFRNNSDPFGRTIVTFESRFSRPGGECYDVGNEFQCRTRVSNVQAAILSGECNSYEREKVNEDYRTCAYPDPLHRNIPTIGIGFNLNRPGARRDIVAVGGDYDKLVAGTQCLKDYQIRQLFNKDMASAVSCAQMFVGNNWYRLGVTRQSAIADMAFNLGCTRLDRFTRFRAALQSTPPNYRAAILEMQDSLWCRQVKSRCTRNVACMR